MKTEILIRWSIRLCILFVLTQESSMTKLLAMESGVLLEQLRTSIIKKAKPAEISAHAEALVRHPDMSNMYQARARKLTGEYGKDYPELNEKPISTQEAAIIHMKAEKGVLSEDEALDEVLQQRAAAKEADRMAAQSAKQSAAKRIEMQRIKNATNPYDKLDVKPGAPQSEISIAYKKLALKYNPDSEIYVAVEGVSKEESAALFQDIKKAFGDLDDPKKAAAESAQRDAQRAEQDAAQAAEEAKPAAQKKAEKAAAVAKRMKKIKDAPNYYKKLGLEPNATEEQIQTLVKRNVVGIYDLSRQVTEGMSQAEQEAYKATYDDLNTAWETLTNPKKRADYDAKLAQSAKGAEPKIARIAKQRAVLAALQAEKKAAQTVANKAEQVLNDAELTAKTRMTELEEAQAEFNDAIKAKNQTAITRAHNKVMTAQYNMNLGTNDVKTAFEHVRRAKEAVAKKTDQAAQAVYQESVAAGEERDAAQKEFDEATNQTDRQLARDAQRAAKTRFDNAMDAEKIVAQEEKEATQAFEAIQKKERAFPDEEKTRIDAEAQRTAKNKEAAEVARQEAELKKAHEDILWIQINKTKAQDALNAHKALPLHKRLHQRFKNWWAARKKVETPKAKPTTTGVTKK